MTRPNITALVAGLIFALGLGCAGMTQPAKVLGFLDVLGAWDPSLALVMIGAVGVHFLFLRASARVQKPLLAAAFESPPARDIDLRLVGGAALFGFGWGASGFCPGPALVALATLSPGAIAFVAAMLLGMWSVDAGSRARSPARSCAPFATLLPLVLVVSLPVAGAAAQLAPEAVQPTVAAAPVAVPPPINQGPKPRDIVVAYNRGLRFGVSPGVLFSPSSGDIGFSIAGDVRYGFDLGALVLAPGVRLAAYFPPDQTVLVGLGTLRLTFPIGPVGPFVVGGAGPGWIKDPSEVGLAYVAGGGFMVHIGLRFGIGAEVTYQAIANTHFDALFFGPLFLLSF